MDHEDEHAHSHDDGHEHAAHDHHDDGQDVPAHMHEHFGDHSEAETPPGDHGHAHSDDAYGHGGADERRYSDGFVTWTYTCAAPDRLNRVDAGELFAGFDRLERVNVQFFDGTRSASETLTPSAPALPIR